MLQQDGSGQVEELGATFALENEDHTLANALRYFLNKKWACRYSCMACSCTHPHGTTHETSTPHETFHSLHCPDARLVLRSPHVSFCGYSIPHPSEPVTNLRIQTTGE